MKILIDNGHGIDTPGKRSPDGSFREYLYCREIAAEIVNRLKVMGLDAELLTPEERDIPLARRCRRANAVCSRLGASNVLLVSIHSNAAGSGANWMPARGWEAWTSPGITRADTMATLLYESARKYLPEGTPLRKDLSAGDPDKEAAFYILRHTRCPAVLTENLFQDNREDVEYLLSEAGRKAIAALHVEAITNYIKR